MRRAPRTSLLAITCLLLATGVAQAQLTQVPTDLESLRKEYERQLAQRSGTPFRSKSLARVAGDTVVIDAIASGDVDALAADLIALGLQDPAVAGRIVSGRLPLSAIGALSGLSTLAFAEPALSVGNVGTVTSQGDPAMRSDVVRATYGVDGTGVSVGVLSDSFDCQGGAVDDLASGDLSPVTVLQDEPGCGNGTDEGRGMLQIVHDVAPGAGLLFATALGGRANYVNNILNLQMAGANVIVDDQLYLGEPMFQDGVIALAVDSVVASGVSYFSAAGNAGRQAYGAGFNDSGIDLGPDGTNQIPLAGETFIAHDFDPGPGVDLFQTVTFPTGLTRIVLQWADIAFSVSGAPGAATDLELALFVGGDFLFGAFNGNTGHDPFEILTVDNPGPPIQAEIAIGKFAGPDPSQLKYVAFDNGFTVDEYDTASGTIYGHPNAAGAATVGAAAYFVTPAFGVAPPLLDPYSSGGTTPILFTTAGDPTYDPRATKPELTAPDGGNTTFFGFDIPEDPDTFPNFFGTSAAAPHAAGVAALMLQYAPALSPGSIRSLLEQTAIDIGPPGFDNDSGYGLIQADAALGLAVCGNGTVDPGEACDDGNTVGGDGCSSTCQFKDSALPTTADSFLRLSRANSNEGANKILSLRNGGRHRPVVAFDLTGRNPAAIVAARLVLTVKRNGKGWDGGRAVEAHALLTPFAEGNGELTGAAPSTRGSGPGVTWNCAIDTEIGNPNQDCSPGWNGGNFVAAPSDSQTYTDATAGEVSFDVTADVKAGRTAWLLKKADEKQRGRMLYYSREGAAASADPTLAPRLELDY